MFHEIAFSLADTWETKTWQQLPALSGGLFVAYLSFENPKGKQLWVHTCHACLVTVSLDRARVYAAIWHCEAQVCACKYYRKIQQYDVCWH